MAIKAFVMYKGGLSHYLIVQEHEGIYQAHLSRYDGPVDRFPPLKFTLIKGTENWVGSIDDTRLLHSLGTIIEAKEKEQLFLDGGKKTGVTQPGTPRRND